MYVLDHLDDPLMAGSTILFLVLMFPCFPLFTYIAAEILLVDYRILQKFSLVGEMSQNLLKSIFFRMSRSGIKSVQG